MNKGQQIAKTQELAEDKIAFEAQVDKQTYTSSQAQDDLPHTPEQDQDKQ